MSEQVITGHSINYKDDNGNWHPMSVLDQTLYDTYKAYCISNGIDYVTQEEYCQSLYDIVRLAKTMADAGVVTITSGGTGATTAVDARKNLGVLSEAEVNALIQTALQNANKEIANLKSKLAELEQKLNNLTLADLGLIVGTEAPDNTTPGTVYFRY